MKSNFKRSEYFGKKNKKNEGKIFVAFDFCQNQNVTRFSIMTL